MLGEGRTQVRWALSRVAGEEVVVRQQVRVYSGGKAMNTGC